MHSVLAMSINSFEDNVNDIRDLYRRSLILDYHIANGMFVIDLISVDTPGQGIGSDIMNRLTDNADDHGIVIELEASSHGGRNIRQKKLEKWYERFGFVLTGSSSSEGSPMMLREPRSKDL